MNIIKKIKSWFHPEYKDMLSREDKLQIGSYIAWWRGEIRTPKIYPKGNCISFINIRNEHMGNKFGPCKGLPSKNTTESVFIEKTEEELIALYNEYRK